MQDPTLFTFDERFLEKYAGNKILHDPITAVIELIANSWDAGAHNVNITWPTKDKKRFEITDDGCGLTSIEFEKIWSRLYYNRQKMKGKYADTIPGEKKTKRLAFGKNGIGRCAGFYFGAEYIVISRKEFKEIKYKVTSNSIELPFIYVKEYEKDTTETHGTIIYVENSKAHEISVSIIRSEIAMRFLSDPSFNIYVQNELLTFDDIHLDNIEEIEIEIDDKHKIKILIIDTKESDKTTKHHGIAWRVNNRLVGSISWNYLSNNYMIDGRRLESKRYSFIIFADCLNKYVLHDWSGFERSSEFVERVEKAAYQMIWQKIIDLSEDQREENLIQIKDNLNKEISMMSPLKKEKWENFILETQKKCPALTQKELTVIGSILANLELSKGKYNLLYQLNDLSPNQLDELDNVLKTWSLDYAKIILDELENRINLLANLEMKLYQSKVDEVHEMQPLFKRGLWIFGPEYETIEYTSNQGMTHVIQKLYGQEIKGSRSRPDFAILKDSTVGLYSYPIYDEEGGEIGIDKLVIIELKAPGVEISDTEMNQAWKYVKELLNRGMIQANASRVTCFVVGEKVESAEQAGRKHNNDTVIIKPIIYNTVIKRAKSRLFNLFDKIKEAPFVKEIDASFFQEIEEKKNQLFA